MTAKEKFEARLQELGLMEEWKKQGECGKVAVEREDGIILLVHENDEDKFTEEHFPTFSELRKNPKFVEECKGEWYADWDDDKFVRNLACWLDGYSDECPLFPVDVYFPGNEMMTEWKDFEDDLDEPIDLELEEDEYMVGIDENRGKVELIGKQLDLFRKELVEMIQTEFKSGHNLPSGWAPHPGWGSTSFYGYEVEHDTTYKIKEDMTICFSNAFGSEVELYLSTPDFPIEVLIHIYDSME